MDKGFPTVRNLGFRGSRINFHSILAMTQRVADSNITKYGTSTIFCSFPDKGPMRNRPNAIFIFKQARMAVFDKNLFKP